MTVVLKVRCFIPLLEAFPIGPFWFTHLLVLVFLTMRAGLYQKI